MNTFFKQAIVLLFVVIASGSCTRGFEELNTDTTKISDIDNASLEYVFSAAQYRGILGINGPNGSNAYQRLESQFCNTQSQYFATTSQGFPSDRNVMVGSWLDFSWTYFYSDANAQLSTVMELTKPGGKLADPIKYAISQIWKVNMFMRITDAWGAVPYSASGNGKTSVPYDSQQDIYNDFFKLLKEANATLSAYTGSIKYFEKGDLIYGGDVKKWLKLGNSLWLRAAMHVSKIDPSRAKTEAEAAAAAAGGLILGTADNAMMKVASNTPNPLAAISNFGEFRMSAAMESVLKGYNDPRLQKFFDPAASGGAYKGIRNGLSQVQQTVAQNGNNVNSNIASAIGFNNRATTPWAVFTAGETYLLLAEAKLNGWNVSSASVKTLYEQGIDASMARWGVTDAVALVNYKNGITTAAPLNDIYNSPAVNSVPVALGITEAVQREQIGTQKWLALFPYGSEAWAELRRTGFPRLYPRLNSDNEDAPAADPVSVRRLQYPPTETSTNAEGLAGGIQKLGGPDKVNTRVWWNP